MLTIFSGFAEPTSSTRRSSGARIKLQRQRLVRIKLEAVSLDSTSVKVHPVGTGAPKKNGPQCIGKSRGRWNTKIHMAAADARTAVKFSLSPGGAHDAPEGREQLRRRGR